MKIPYDEIRKGSKKATRAEREQRQLSRAQEIVHGIRRRSAQTPLELERKRGAKKGEKK